jgi:hypothetical protein
VRAKIEALRKKRDLQRGADEQALIELHTKLESVVDETQERELRRLVSVAQLQMSTAFYENYCGWVVDFAHDNRFAKLWNTQCLTERDVSANAYRSVGGDKAPLEQPELEAACAFLADNVHKQGRKANIEREEPALPGMYTWL